MEYTTIIATVFLIVSLTSGQELDWSYDESAPDGPSKWVDNYPLCGGTNQSPIDVITSRVQRLSGPTSFTFTNYDRVQSGPPFTLSNTGHTAMVSVNVKDITISGGGLPGTFALEQVHLHWGENDGIGSEHLVDSAAHPVEMHFVHYNRDLYSDVASAAASGDPDAVAVLGVWFDIDNDNPTPEIANIINNVKNIPYRDSSVFIAPFRLAGLLPQSHLGSYFRYSGSLTTPGCNEALIWTLFTRPMYVTSSQIDELRQLRRNGFGQPDNPMTYNYRPVQPINSRTVYVAQ